MMRLKWSEDKFRERVLAVLQTTTYGKTTFDMFLTAEGPPTKVKAITCEYCGEQISENEKYNHQQEGICLKFKLASPETVKEAVDKIRKLTAELTVQKPRPASKQICPPEG